MHASDSVVKVLVGNKSDMIEDRQVSEEEGKYLAADLGVNFFQTSAKTGLNIEQMFVYMAEEVKKNLDKDENIGVLSYTGSKLLKNTDKDKDKQDCC